MKINLAVTLDVDPDEWMAEHHRGGKTVEGDVAAYIWMVFDSLGPVQDGAITEVKVEVAGS